MHYLDSSAIVKIYIDEPGSEWMRELRSRSHRVDTLFGRSLGRKSLLLFIVVFVQVIFQAPVCKVPAAFFARILNSFLCVCPSRKP
jgi:hypothetical protein